MSLIKTHIFLAQSNCMHLMLERDFFQGHNNNRRLQSAVLRNHRRNIGETLKRHSKTSMVMEGSETKVKKGAKKKGSEVQQKGKRKSDGATTTRGGNSSLAPADFCGVEEELDEVDEDDELGYLRGLILDLSYRPINVVSWKRALCLEILDKADVLEYYDQAIQATNRAYFIPAVLRVSSFVHSPKSKKVRLNLNRNNIFMRDKFRCQYCNTRDNLTIDHVVAASRGGGWEWENLVDKLQSLPAPEAQVSTPVTACSTCNVKKGDKSLEECRMKLMKMPRVMCERYYGHASCQLFALLTQLWNQEPKELDSMDLPPNYRTFRVLTRNIGTPTEWLDYLPNRPPLF